MPLFIIIILSLFLLGDVVWGTWAVSRLVRRGVRGTWAMWVGLGVVGVFLGVVLGSLVASIYVRGSGATWAVPKVLQMSVFLWHLLILPLTLVVMTLASVGAAAVSRVRKPKVEVDAPCEGSQEALLRGGLSRRRLLAVTAAVAPPAAVALTTGIALPRLEQFRVRRLTVPIAGLPADLDGLTIAHLSDTHLGEFTPPRVYRQLIEATNALRADLIVHTGDVINVDADDIPEAAAGLARLSAPMGVVVCEGNHDLIQSPRRFWDEMRRTGGVRFLRNETVTLVRNGHPVQIFGLRWGGVVPGPGPMPRDGDDAAMRRPDRSDAAIAESCRQLGESVEGDAFPILLAHHPHAFDFAPFARLTLAGHTHGGQLNVSKQLSPGRLMYRYWSGLYADGGGRKLVVSNGAGNWFPLRINAPAEIVKLTLRRG